jgi:hypothetical protein
MTTTRLRSGCVSSRGWLAPLTKRATLPRTSIIASAYGRADSMRSCARRILAVATISMVRVICRVEDTLPMRSFMSRRVGMPAP